MKQVMDTLKRKDAEKRLRVLKMEIDYELLTLFDAMKNDDKKQMEISKQTLEKYRLELLHIKQ